MRSTEGRNRAPASRGRAFDALCALPEVVGVKWATPNPMKLKTALALMGEDCGAARPPAAWPLSAGQTGRRERFMHKNNLLKPAR